MSNESTEIAQSRSKSEVLFTRYTGLEIDPIAYDFNDSQREKIFAFTDWCMGAAERDTRERCAQIADLWTKSHSCNQHDDDPCCHVRTGAGIAERIRGKV